VADEIYFEPGRLGDVAVDAALLASEQDAALWRAFGALPDRCKRLLNLLTTDPPPSYAEISQTLGLPVGSIGPTRARCLDCLRRSGAVRAIA